MAGVENTGQEEHRQYSATYPPVSRCFIKKEPHQSDEDQDERDKEKLNLISYPPLPHGDIKEGSELEEEHDSFITGEQVITYC